MNAESLPPVFAVVLATAMLALFALPTSAGEIYVPDDTPNTGECNVWPFDPNHPIVNGSFRYQLVIPANLLGQKEGSITEVAFAPCNSVTFKAQQFEMRMSHTTLATPSLTFADNLPDARVVIPAGSFVWSRKASVWNPLHLSNPFFYNGRDNLTIEFRYRGGELSGSTTTSDRYTLVSALKYYRIYGPGTYSSLRARGMDTNPLKIRLTINVVTTTGFGLPRPGGTMNLLLKSEHDAGLPYQVGTSLGTGPIQIGNRQIDLGYDAILGASLLGLLPTVFVGYAGRLDAQGEGIAKINILRNPLLIGVRLHSAFLTLHPSAPSGVQSISSTFSFTITK